MLTENATSLPSGRTKGTLAPPAVGFLLIDSSRKPIYINSEAIRILTFPAYPPKKKQLEMSCLSWNWRERSSVKITERTHAKRAEALHCRREGWHPKTAFAGYSAGFRSV